MKKKQKMIIIKRDEDKKAKNNNNSNNNNNKRFDGEMRWQLIRNSGRLGFLRIQKYCVRLNSLRQHISYHFQSHGDLLLLEYESGKVVF